MEKQDDICYGFTQVRTARTIAAIIAFVGMFLLLIQRVLAAVLVMANEALGLAFARYNNFTGRFAAQNFAEDKKLLALLKDVQGIVPMAETAVTVLLVVAVVLLLVAVLGLAFPKQFSHILVALKLLKWSNGSPERNPGEEMGAALTRLGNVPLKKLAIPVAVVACVAIVVGVISSVVRKSEQASVEAAVQEMQGKALEYINTQRSYFGKNHKVGGPKALQLQDSTATDFFIYKVTASRFTATLVKPLGECAEGSRWSVSAEAKGLFTQELYLYRNLPKDEACAKLTPEFTRVGKK